MRKCLSLIFAMSILVMSGYGQTISITSTNTASICYNDGTLTINATGGTAPYTDTIISGPTNPNLSYPIGLGAGQNVFTDLPHGAFTIRVHDAAGHSGTFTASVGGTYEFPTDSLYQDYFLQYTDTLICLADSATGRWPYQYAISSVGPNSGFSAYQNQNFFPHLCSGEYWVRLRDSCGNIFTNTFTISYNNLYGEQYCSNLAAGDVYLGANGGIAPYTFNIINAATQAVIASNQTGYFYGLSLPANATWSVSDACGQIYTSPGGFNDVQPIYSATCPFNGSLTVPGYGGTPTAPLVFTCLSCIPVQRDTFYTVPIYNQPIFSGLSSGTSYVLEMSDACGNVAIDTYLIAPLIYPQVNVFSCHSIAVTYIYPDGSQVPSSDIDSIILTHNGMHYTSTTGVFFDLAENYNLPHDDSLEVFTNIGCNLKQFFYVSIPTFYVSFDAHHGPNCDPVWNGAALNTPREHLYFISSTNDTTFGHPIPGVPDSALGYYYLKPGETYTIVSDSGCTMPYTMPAIRGTLDSVSSYVDCQGLPTVTLSGYDSSFQYSYNSGISFYGGAYIGYFVKFYLHDTLVYTSDTAAYSDPPYNKLTFNPTDTGIFTYKVFLIGVRYGYLDSLQNYHDYRIFSTYDTLCPEDSGSIYVTRNTIPYPYVRTASECYGLLATPPLLTIYGGSIPYTVQIAGIDTFVMNTNTAVFPYTALGSYNVIAYDNCGISRSFTFTINDTCSCAVPSSVLAVSNTGLTYHFSDSLIAGTGPIAFSWNFGDGTVTVDSQNVSHTFQIPLPGTVDTVTVIVSDSCGSDTLTRVISIPLGIGDIGLSAQVSVYPNPNQGSFTIAVSNGTKITLTAEIIDVLGQTVYKQNIHSGENRIDQALNAGIYTVKVSDGEVYTVKMMSVK